MWKPVASMAGALSGIAMMVGAALVLCTQTIAADGPTTVAADRSANNASSWIDRELLAAAKPEGTVVVYSAINEQEGLPSWQLFEQATGLKVQYVRASDAQLISRILIESRTDKPTWDILSSTAVHKLPQQLLAEIEPSEAAHLIPAARDSNHRWYGTGANYDVPSFNTRLVNVSTLPQTYEELAGRSDWEGHVANNETDAEWLAALVSFYGEAKARALLGKLVTTLKPALISGHLQVARAVGAGEYWASLNNYVSLTLNVKLGGAPIDFWAIEPIALFFHEVGVDAKAPHPNAARLAANFVLSQEAQRKSTTWGRLPVRPDVEANPPGVLDLLRGKKVIPITLSGDTEKKADGLYKELVAGRAR
jgi:iron(III) transport system substrate-binding protein